MEIKRKEGESGTSLLYRFSKKVQQSGILKEVRKRRFHTRKANRNKRRVLALKRSGKKRELDEKRKLGLL
jgi:ribosomal protein S21